MENNNRGNIRLKFFADIKEAKSAIRNLGKEVEFLDKKVKSVRLTGFNKTQQKAVNKVAGGMPQSSTHAWYTQWATTVAQLDKVRAQAEIATTEIYKQLAIEKQKLAITQKSVELNAKVAMLNDKTTRTAYINNLVKEAQVQTKIQTSLAASKPYVDAIANRKIAQASIEAQVSKKMLEQADIIKQQAYYAERINLIRQQGIKRARKEFGVNQNSLLKTTAMYMIIRKTVNLLVESLKISADWTENLNLFAVTFGKGYEGAVDWAVDFADKLGYSSVEIVKYTGLFKQLSDAIGVTADTGKEVSKVLTQLGADISSFYNISLESAMEKLQAGVFSGQTKPLRAVGIDVTYQSIDNLLATNEELSKLGITSKKLTQDQKVLARTILVATAAMNAWGDSAKTINSLANQIKVFQGSLQNLGLAIGDTVAPVVTQLITYLNGFIMSLTTIIRMFTSMVKKVPYEVGDMTNSVADEYQELEEETGKLLSFDKFEALNTNAEENQNATLALTAELNKVIAEYQEKQNKELKEMQNNAIKVRNAIMGFLGYEWDEETNDFVKVNHNLELIGGTLAIIGAAKLWSWLNSVSKIKMLGNAFKILAGGTLSTADQMTRLQKVSASLTKLGIFALAVQVMDLISKWDELDAGQKTARISLIAFTAMLIGLGVYAKVASGNLAGLGAKLKQLVSSLKASSVSFKTLGLTMSAVLLLVAGLIENWDKMDSFQRVASVLLTAASAFFAFAIAAQTAKHALKAWTVVGFIGSVGAALATIMSAKSAAQGMKLNAYATGGTPDRGEIFSMNEYGRPEAFVKTGGHTSVINDITMGSLVKQGVIEAVRETGIIQAIRESGAKFSIEGDPERMFKVVDKEGRRITGKGWTNR